MTTRDKRISAAHLAGFFDGEGYIQVLAEKDYRGTDRKGHCFKLRLNLINTCVDKLKQIQATYGGNLRELKGPARHKTVYRLEWWSGKAVPVLEVLLSDPDFYIKRRQAELALEFWALKDHFYTYGKSGYPLETREQLLRICDEVKHLNRRGVLAVAETKPVPQMGSDSPQLVEKQALVARL